MPSTENEPFDTLMRSCLGDDFIWGHMLLDGALTAPARAWLRSTVQGIDHQLDHNADTLEENLLDLTDEAARTRKAEFYRWRKRARHMKFLCQRRIADLDERHEHQKSRADEYKNLLLDLADAVLEHQEGALTDTQLHAELDSLRLPGTPTRNLREHLEHLEHIEVPEPKPARAV